MYFKERGRSSLYKREQLLEQARLTHRLEEIKHRKLRTCDSENRLPVITHRPSQLRPCQKAALDTETERLTKRILQLKTNKSQYFEKVIGVNLSAECPRGRKGEPEGKTSLQCNKSVLEVGSDAE